MKIIFLAALLFIARITAAQTFSGDPPVGTPQYPDTSSTFDTVSQDSLNWNWNPGNPRPVPRPSPPSPKRIPVDPPISVDPIPISSGQDGEEFILSDSEASGVIETLLGQHSTSKAVETFRSAKAATPTASDLQTAQSSGGGSGLGSGGDSLSIWPGSRPYPGRYPYPPRPYPSDPYPSWQRRLACRVTYYPTWKICCYYKFWWY